jgi:hypothetical protein
MEFEWLRRTQEHMEDLDISHVVLINRLKVAKSSESKH